jgi:methylenetetrahydrofolate dehydrogenase (NADP+)/methenyltetrahydrofolate cyclohydrolase
VSAATVTGTARLLEGGPIAADIHTANAERAAAFTRRRGHPPTLAVVICGRSAPSMVYLRRILASCEKDGIEGRLIEVGDDVGEPGPDVERHLVDAIRSLSADPTVAGIIVQQPLPPRVRLRPIIDAIDPAKDIDGIHPLNAGLLRLGYEGFVPATAHATIEILQRSGVEIAGQHAVVVGRSAVVGLPAAFMLVKADATVTVCHSKTRDLPARVREADIVVVAAGRPGLVTGDMLKPGAVVVDVGINMVDGHLVGDVEFETARQVASAITPVPGGVGPLTNALLLAHLMRAAERQEAAEMGRGFE